MSEHPSSSELLAWTLVGLAAGLVTGLAAGAWLGAGSSDPTSVTGSARDQQPKRTGGAGPLKGSEAMRLVQQRLREDPALQHLDLQVIAVGPGIVELHGWVASRAERTRAARAAAGVVGLSSLVNSVLVHGEDDFPTPVRDATDQPA